MHTRLNVLDVLKQTRNLNEDDYVANENEELNRMNDELLINMIIFYNSNNNIGGVINDNEEYDIGTELLRSHTRELKKRCSQYKDYYKYILKRYLCS